MRAHLFAVTISHTCQLITISYKKGCLIIRTGLASLSTMKNNKINSLVPTEAQECALFIAKARYHPILSKHLIHNANGGSRHILEAVNLRRQGVKKGVSDYFLAYPMNGHHGLWIEMKRADKSRSVVSREQKDWIELMRSVNYQAHVAYGANMAWEICINYLNGK